MLGGRVQRDTFSDLRVANVNTYDTLLLYVYRTGALNCSPIRLRASKRYGNARHHSSQALKRHTYYDFYCHGDVNVTELI